MEVAVEEVNLKDLNVNMHAFSWNKFRYIGDYLHDVAVVFFLCCLNAKSLNWGAARDVYIYIYIHLYLLFI